MAIPLAALMAAVPAYAQFTTEAKVAVLREMDRVLAQEAFVPGVDLAEWRPFLRTKQEQLDGAETPHAFAAVVNSGLKEFGVSHINLSASRMRRRSWGSPPPFGLQSQSPVRSRFRGTGYKWIDDKTVVVRVSDFDRGYSRPQAERVFEEVRGASRLVLDLRSNPGGEVENMRHFLGLVLPENQPIGTFVSKRTAMRYIASGRGDGRDPVKIAAWANRKFTPR
ncbi:MAG TPA: S41 family peptidase, partial [Fimbriimonas sp.]